jgi:DNA-binding MarR family transcriptional regulator
MMDRAQRIMEIQEAIAAGRRRYYDAERRATYPANPDEDTVALAEHYRINYPRARILKALSYFVDVSTVDLCAVSGIHRAIMAMEVDNIERRTGLSISLIRARSNKVIAFRLTRAADRDELRAVIQGGWTFNENAARDRGRCSLFNAAIQ